VPEIGADTSVVLVPNVAEVQVEGPGFELFGRDEKEAVGCAAPAEAPILVAGRQGDVGLQGQTPAVLLEEAPLEVKAHVGDALFPGNQFIVFKRSM